MNVYPSVRGPGEAGLIRTAASAMRGVDLRGTSEFSAVPGRVCVVFLIAVVAALALAVIPRADATGGSEWAPSLAAVVSVNGHAAPRHVHMTLAPIRPVSGTAYRAGRRLLDEAKRNAVATALACVGTGARVEIRADGVLGPSTALMFALAIVEGLRGPGPKKTVAGTGALDDSGRVQPVGGIEHKVSAAEDAGATLFLVPARQFDEARSAAVRLRVVPVNSLDDALRAIGSRGCEV